MIIRISFFFQRKTQNK